MKKGSSFNPWTNVDPNHRENLKKEEKKIANEILRIEVLGETNSHAKEFIAGVF